MDIIEIICNLRNVSVSDVMSDARHGLVPSTRFMVWLYLHYDNGWSANRIAKTFGRTRTCVFRGMRILKHQMKYNKEMREEYQGILKRLEGMTESTPSENMEEKY